MSAQVFADEPAAVSWPDADDKSSVTADVKSYCGEVELYGFRHQQNKILPHNLRESMLFRTESYQINHNFSRHAAIVRPPPDGYELAVWDPMFHVLLLERNGIVYRLSVHFEDTVEMIACGICTPRLSEVGLPIRYLKNPGLGVCNSH